MKKINLLTTAAMLFTSPLFSQCPNPSAMDTLNINEVSALILNGGDLHWNLFDAGYEVPKGSGKRSIFASAIWMGGFDTGGQLHLAAQTYRQSGYDFWAGPLDTITASTDSATVNAYNKIWKINRYNVEEFKYQWTLGNVQNGSYTPDQNILSWPANGTGNFSHVLAPYADVNNNNTYDPLVGGDYPKIKGDQMLYWIMNDNCGTHTGTGGLPFGIEIHASAYAFTCPQIADSMEAINYTTFYHYDIFNRSAMQYDSVYLGYWQDADLGNYQDDYVGCNPSGNYGYAYNGDSIDGGPWGYGLRPPMLSTIVLNGPLANPNDSIDNDNDGIIDETGEKNLLGHFHYYNNDATPQGNPNGAQYFYNYLSGTWGDNTPVTYGGTGYGGTTPTRFIFPDFPYIPSGWSEVTTGNFPNDRRFVMSSGPFTFFPGAKTEFDFAIVWSRDTSLAYGTQAYFDENLKDNQKIQQWFATDSFPSCLSLSFGLQEINQNTNNLIISPNPSSDFISVSYKSKTSHAQFEIIDVMGRNVSSTKYRVSRNGGKINITQLPQGIYLLKVIDGELLLLKKFVKN